MCGKITKKSKILPILTQRWIFSNVKIFVNMGDMMRIALRSSDCFGFNQRLRQFSIADRGLHKFRAFECASFIKHPALRPSYGFTKNREAVFCSRTRRSRGLAPCTAVGRAAPGRTVLYLYIIKPPKLSSNYPEIQRRDTNQTNFTTFSSYINPNFQNQNFFELTPQK